MSVPEGKSKPLGPTPTIVTDYPRITAESGAPYAVAQHRDLGAARPVVVRRQEASEGGTGSSHAEEVPRDPDLVQRVARRGVLDQDRERTPCGETSQAREAALPARKQIVLLGSERDRYRGPVVVQTPPDNEFLLAIDRETPEKHRLDCGKRGCRGSDTDGQGQGGGRSAPRPPRQAPNRQPETAHEPGSIVCLSVDPRRERNREGSTRSNIGPPAREHENVPETREGHALASARTPAGGA